MDNENSISPGPPPSDGLIDFEGYTTRQLLELQSSIDPQRFPLNHSRLIEELARRETGDTLRHSTRWEIQFSPSKSFWSWVEAKRRGQWFYGHGFLEIQSGQIVLQGLQRTWLGMAEHGERCIALESIRNVAREHATVIVQVRGRFSWRRLEFDCESVESAVSLCERLPPAQDTSFEKEWQETRTFQKALYAPRNYPWGATTLVTVNVVAFLIFFTTTKSWSGIAPQLFIVWGSNFGPLTVSGQWWRLVTPLFLHASFLHLILNMWVLWNVGRLAERLFGHTVFLSLYLFTGVVAGLATIAWNPAMNVLGSSGAVFGILGAVLASIIRPSHRTPSAFVRSHWLSLLLFTIVNLVSGFFQIGIANAAHVGGFASGVLLGAVVALPRNGYLERHYRQRQFGAATASAIAVLLIALLLTPGIGNSMGPAQHYLRTRQWFITGEADSLRQWQLLLNQAQAGSISNDALARAFETKVLPFWNTASERTVPQASLPPDEQVIAREVNT